MVLLAIVAIGAPVRAASAPEPLHLRYGVYFAGIPVGDLAVRLIPQPGGYRSELDFGARGLLDRLLALRGSAAAVGLWAPDAAPATTGYHAAYSRRAEPREVAVRFDPERRAATEVTMHKNGEPRASEVPEELRVGVVDPLTAIFELRRRVALALGDGADTFTVAVFDGRRRYDIGGKMRGRTTIDSDGKVVPVIEVALNFMPVAGFDEEGDDRTQPLHITASLSDDPALLPLRLTGDAAGLPWVINLSEVCAEAEACRLGT